VEHEVELVVNALREQYDVLGRYEYDYRQLVEGGADELESIDTPEVMSTRTTLIDYVARNCPAGLVSTSR
jgi:hypothetical protein